MVMSSEEMIEEILMEAHSMGFREELIQRVKGVIDSISTKRTVDIYEEEFQKIIIEMRD
jgi:hypothetical protein